MMIYCRYCKIFAQNRLLNCMFWVKLGERHGLSDYTSFFSFHTRFNFLMEQYVSYVQTFVYMTHFNMYNMYVIFKKSMSEIFLRVPLRVKQYSKNR